MSGLCTLCDRYFQCVQVSDFGLSRVMDAVSGSTFGQHSFGALTHAAPELIRGEQLCKASDVYSVGVLVWELLTGQVSLGFRKGVTPQLPTMSLL